MTSKKEKEIIVLPFPDSVRTRRDMYYGDCRTADHAMKEVFDNAMDRVFADPSVKRIAVKNCANKRGDYFYVANDGIPFPINWDEEHQATKLDLASSRMHSGVNFGSEDTSIGSNGIGIKGANALGQRFFILSSMTEESSETTSPVARAAYKKGVKDQFYFIHYESGHKKGEGVTTIPEFNKLHNLKLPGSFSTIVVNEPELGMYDDTSATASVERASTALLIFERFYGKKIKISIDGNNITIGNSAYKYSAQSEWMIPGVTKEGKISEDEVEIKILLNFEFTRELETITSSGNVNTRDVWRGYHINKGREIIANALKKVFNIPHDHLQKGMISNSLVLGPGANMQLAGQTKDSMVRIRNFADNNWNKLQRAVERIIEKNKDDIAPHVARLNEFAISMDKLSARDFVKGMVSISKTAPVHVSKKVRDAASKDRSKCTLYIVEGESASSSLLEARDPMYDALFMMRGVPLNAVGMKLEDVFDNPEYLDLISCIGAGVDSYFEIDKVRYGRLVICTDSDPDGSAIAALLVGTLGYHLKFLIEKGMVFINQSPLYFQNGKYLRADEESKLVKNKEFTRFKGLGELNADQAYDVFFGDHQRMIRLTVEGMDSAMDLLTSTERKYQLMIKNKIIIE